MVPKADDGGTPPPLKVHDPDEKRKARKSQGGRERWDRWGAKYHGLYDAIVKALADYPDGLSVSELTPAAGLRSGYVTGTRLRRLAALGLVAQDGVRKERNFNVNVWALTDLGRQKALEIRQHPSPANGEPPHG